MPMQRFLIANMNSGLVTNPDPWLIMDDAWFRLENVHTWRGKIEKRIGAQEMDTSQAYAIRQQFTRLRILIGTTDNAGAFNNIALAKTVPGVVQDISGQMFSVGAQMYTVAAKSVAGAAATMISSGAGIPTYYTNGANAGEFSVTGATALTSVYFYPTLPVMALPSYQISTLNTEQLVAFDTQFAYTYTTGTGWNILGPVPPTANSGLWTGSDSDFHWTTNWRGLTGDTYLLFVVNNIPADGILYWNGAIWTKITPRYITITAVNYVIQTARIVMPFKGRLLLINTTETRPGGSATFVNRVRYSQIGDPTDAANAWDEVTVGRGGFIDIPTREQIVSAQYLKDRLIIFCERSTWELVYTGNEVFPFRPQQLNIELGVESQNSLVTFDKNILGFGSTGVHNCNGLNVSRIDDQIPDEIFSILNDNNGPQRVNAIRDYYSEEIYWSFVESAFGVTYPNQFLVYNYKTGSWSINYDSITAMGLYQAKNSVTWADMTTSWAAADDQWADPSDLALFRAVVGGNQEGFTFVMTHTNTTLSLSLSIYNITIVNNIVTFFAINHNLIVGDWINVQNAVGITGLNSATANYRVNGISAANPDQFSIVLAGVAGAYLGGATVSRVPKIFMQSKQYNFFNDIGKRMHIPRIDFLVDTQGAYTPTPPLNTAGILMDYLTSFSATNTIAQGGAVTGATIGTSILNFAPQSTQEATATKIWRCQFPLLEGDVCQLTFAYSDLQMAVVAQTTNDFRLHAMMFHVRSISDVGY